MTLSMERECHNQLFLRDCFKWNHICGIYEADIFRRTLFLLLKLKMVTKTQHRSLLLWTKMLISLRQQVDTEVNEIFSDMI